MTSMAAVLLTSTVGCRNLGRTGRLHSGRWADVRCFRVVCPILVPAIRRRLVRSPRVDWRRQPFHLSTTTKAPQGPLVDSAERPRLPPVADGGNCPSVLSCVVFLREAHLSSRVSSSSLSAVRLSCRSSLPIPPPAGLVPALVKIFIANTAGKILQSRGDLERLFQSRWVAF